MTSNCCSVSEALLIEMEQRFRKLEVAVRNADERLGAQQSHIERQIEKADADLSIEGKYESTCRIIFQHERTLDHMVEVRGALARAVEACREDLRTLLERERSGRC